MSKYSALLLRLIVSLSLFGSLSFAIAQRRSVPITGCYSDLSLIENKSLVVGTGSFRIRKVNGRYVATFTELLDDGGSYASPKPVQNFRVNESTGTITFDMPLSSSNRGGSVLLRNASGRVSRNGIQMNWQGHGGDYGENNPFFHRRTRNCS